MAGRAEGSVIVSDEKGRYMLNIDTFQDRACDTGMSSELVVRNDCMNNSIPGGLRSRTGVTADPSFGVPEEAGLVPPFPRSFSSSVLTKSTLTRLAWVGTHTLWVSVVFSSRSNLTAYYSFFESSAESPSPHR